MEIIGVTCDCGSERAELLTSTIATCLNPHCLKPISVDMRDYHAPDVVTLEEIAKEQAIKDIKKPVLLSIDWHTCFDTDNITIDIPEECCVYHDGMWYNPENAIDTVIHADAQGKPLY